MMPNKDEKFNLFNLVSERLRIAGETEKYMPPVPEEVSSFLGKLSMLEGVPLYNIIPSDKYLPKEETENIEKGALRLFYLDPEWVAGLLSGALSLAGDTDNVLLTKAMDGIYAAEVHYNDTKEKIKRQITGLYTPAAFEEQLKARLAQKHLVYGDPSPTPAQSNWLYTGFFIRSSIISTWTSVEIVAKGTYDASEPVPRRVVKLEKLAHDTIFCICEGNITEIEITQPPETIHFDNKRLGKNPPMRSATGVLDISEIVKPRGLLMLGDGPTSAKLATKLLSEPLKSKLTITRKEQS